MNTREETIGVWEDDMWSVTTTKFFDNWSFLLAYSIDVLSINFPWMKNAVTHQQYDCLVDLLQVSTISTTTGQANDFLRQLREFVAQQKRPISIVDTHDHHSIGCFGDVIAIEVVCKCSKANHGTNDKRTRSMNTDPASDVSIEPFEAILTVKHSGANEGFAWWYQSTRGFTANAGIGERFP
jgi:hypothetical protein